MSFPPPTTILTLCVLFFSERRSQTKEAYVLFVLGGSVLLENNLNGVGALYSVRVTICKATQFVVGASLPCLFVWTIEEKFGGEFISVDIKGMVERESLFLCFERRELWTSGSIIAMREGIALGFRHTC